ncbi:D-erythronate dehydrogenase [Streptomyces sp. NPDC001980]|uniref:D-erythronate dehydrogenase n=1 Tax=Streptomyces sp. NPDC001980 TaxID=3157126 RepID=UPI00331DD80D
MRIAVTGAFGFLGSRLTATLLEQRMLCGAPIEGMVLADRIVHDDAAGVDDPLVTVVHGDLSDRLDDLFADPVDVIFHLAAAVSAECEEDFDLGMHANLDVTRALLDAARGQCAAGGPVPRLVFSSSLAVYGMHPDQPPASLVDESTLPTPRTSYGTQKLICEQLIADCTRRGFVDGRVARLMTVAVRPGKANAAASAFLSAIIRDPLAGLSATCPVDPGLQVALASPQRTVRGLVRLAEVSRGTGPGQLSGTAPVNLPALTVSVTDMLATLRQAAGDTVADLVTIAPDPAVEAIVGSWPAAFDNTRAAALGLHPDPDFASVLRHHLADQAVTRTTDEPPRP